MNLESVFTDWLTNGAIITSICSVSGYTPPWGTTDSVILDTEYIGNVSGEKTVSPLVRKLVDSTTGKLSTDNITKLANILISINRLRWEKLWATYSITYNPIHNYDMTETGTDATIVNGTDTTAFGKTNTDVSTGNSTVNANIYGFNSSTASPSDTSTGSTSTNTTSTDGGTDSITKDETTNLNHTLTRSGNIGVTTTQQMITSEREVWRWKFYDELFKDLDAILTLKIYE